VAAQLVLLDGGVLLAVLLGELSEAERLGGGSADDGRGEEASMD